MSHPAFSAIRLSASTTLRLIQAPEDNHRYRLHTQMTSCGKASVPGNDIPCRADQNRIRKPESADAARDFGYLAGAVGSGIPRVRISFPISQ
jgi:hypothetical protein